MSRNRWGATIKLKNADPGFNITLNRKQLVPVQQLLLRGDCVFKMVSVLRNNKRFLVQLFHNQYLK